jgi:hypothetical protein
MKVDRLLLAGGTLCVLALGIQGWLVPASREFGHLGRSGCTYDRLSPMERALMAVSELAPPSFF